MKAVTAVITAALFVCLAAGPCLASGPQDPAVAVPDAAAAAAPAAKNKIVGSELTSFQPQLNRTLQALLTVSCLVLLGFGAYKRYGAKLLGFKTPDSSLISIISRHPFGPRSALLVADVAGQRFLIAHTNDDLRLLSRLQTPVSQEMSSLADLLEGAENNRTAAAEILKLVANSGK